MDNAKGAIWVRNNWEDLTVPPGEQIQNWLMVNSVLSSYKSHVYYIY